MTRTYGQTLGWPTIAPTSLIIDPGQAVISPTCTSAMTALPRTKRQYLRSIGAVPR
jgi:hypothetical protein